MTIFPTRNGEPAYVPDLAAEIDDDADLLAEELGCSRALAVRVLAREARIRAECDTELTTQKARHDAKLQLIVDELTEASNVQVQVWALIFATGLDSFILKSRSQAERAKLLGVTRQNMSHFVRRWKCKLGIQNTMFSRTDSAVENSRQARLRVLARRLNGTTEGTENTEVSKS